MDASTRLRWLRIALTVVGLSFVIGITVLNRLWPAGWNWGVGRSHNLAMIVGVYATLGVVLALAARDPLQHLSLIRFTIWSSVVHAAIMAVQAVGDPAERGHLFGDVPVLLLFALVLAALMPRRAGPPAPA